METITHEDFIARLREALLATFPLRHFFVYPLEVRPSPQHPSGVDQTVGTLVQTVIDNHDVTSHIRVPFKDDLLAMESFDYVIKQVVKTFTQEISRRSNPGMITVPIMQDFFNEKVIGSVMIREDAIRDTDMVLSLGAEILEKEGDVITKFKVVEFGLIPVTQHSAFPRK